MTRVAIGISAADVAFAGQMLAHIKNGAPTALRSAINDTLNSERADTVKRTQPEINLPAGDVRERISITDRPHAYSLSGTLSIGYHGVRLDEFKPRPRGTEGRRGGGVSRVALTSKGALKFAHGFGARVDGHNALLVRRGPKRPPVKGKWAGYRLKRGSKKHGTQAGELIKRQAVIDILGPAVVAVFEQRPEILAEVVSDTDAKFHARLLSKVDWLLARGNTNFPKAT